jgi:hypothetical protein
MRDEHDERNELNAEQTQRLPQQSAPVMRRLLGSAISGEAGVEASDYNDPSYFFLNWPSSV